MPGRPTFPVRRASAIRQRALSVPWVCWLIPIPQKIITLPAVPIARATARIVSAGMPQTGATRSGGYFATSSRRASKFSVRSRTKAWLTRPSATRTCMTAL